MSMSYTSTAATVSLPSSSRRREGSSSQSSSTNPAAMLRASTCNRKKDKDVGAATSPMLIAHNVEHNRLVLGISTIGGTHTLRQIMLTNTYTCDVRVHLKSNLGDQIKFQLYNENLMENGQSAAMYNEVFNFIGLIDEMTIPPASTQALVISFLPKESTDWDCGGNEGNGGPFNHRPSDKMHKLDEVVGKIYMNAVPVKTSGLNDICEESSTNGGDDVVSASIIQNIVLRIRVNVCRSVLWVDPNELDLVFDDCVLDSVYVRHFTVWNRSEVPLSFVINYRSTANALMRMLEFTDYDTDEEISGVHDIAGFSHCRVRATIKPTDVGRFHGRVQIENVRDVGNTALLVVRASVTAEKRDEILRVSRSAIDFGDCYAGDTTTVSFSLRNTTNRPMDVDLVSGVPRSCTFHVLPTDEDGGGSDGHSEGPPTDFDEDDGNNNERDSTNLHPPPDVLAAFDEGMDVALYRHNKHHNPHVNITRVRDIDEAGVDDKAMADSVSVQIEELPLLPGQKRTVVLSYAPDSIDPDAVDAGNIDSSCIGDKKTSPANSGGNTAAAAAAAAAGGGGGGGGGIGGVGSEHAAEDNIDASTITPTADDNLRGSRRIVSTSAPDTRRAQLRRRAFHLELRVRDDKGRVIKRRTLQCRARVCTSIVSLHPAEINFGDVSLGTIRAAHSTLHNHSDLPAIIWVSFSSAVVTCRTTAIVIPPRHQFDLKFEICPRKVNSDYEKQVTIINRHSRSNDQILMLRSNNIDKHRVSVHSLFYIISTSKSLQFLDFNYLALNCKSLRVFSLMNITHNNLRVRLTTSSPIEIRLYIVPLSLERDEHHPNGSDRSLPAGTSTATDVATKLSIGSSSPSSSISLGALRTNSTATDVNLVRSVATTPMNLNTYTVSPGAVSTTTSRGSVTISNADSLPVTMSMLLPQGSGAKGRNVREMCEKLLESMQDRPQPPKLSQLEHLDIIYGDTHTNRDSTISSLAGELSRTSFHSKGKAPGVLQKAGWNKMSALDALTLESSAAQRRFAVGADSRAGYLDLAVSTAPTSDLTLNPGAGTGNGGDEATILKASDRYNFSVDLLGKNGSWAEQGRSDRLAALLGLDTSASSSSSIKSSLASTFGSIPLSTRGSNAGGANNVGNGNDYESRVESINSNRDEAPPLSVNDVVNGANASTSNESVRATDVGEEADDHTESGNTGNAKSSVPVAYSALESLVTLFDKDISLPPMCDSNAEDVYVRNLKQRRRDLDVAIESGMIVPMPDELVIPADGKVNVYVVFTPLSTRGNSDEATRIESSGRCVSDKTLDYRPSMPENKIQRREEKVFIHLCERDLAGGKLIQSSVEEAHIPARELLVRAKTCRSAIVLGQRHINFGRVKRNHRRAKSLLISNRTELPLAYCVQKTGSISSGDIHFGEGRRGVIRPFGSKEVNFVFEPTMAGTFLETVSIENMQDVTDRQTITVKALVLKPKTFFLDSLQALFGPVLCGSGVPAITTVVLTNSSKSERSFVIEPSDVAAVIGTDGKASLFSVASIELSMVESASTVGFSKEVEEKIEHLEQKFKIARRKGQVEKVKKYDMKLRQLRSGGSVEQDDGGETTDGGYESEARSVVSDDEGFLLSESRSAVPNACSSGSMLTVTVGPWRVMTIRVRLFVDWYLDIDDTSKAIASALVCEDMRWSLIVHELRNKDARKLVAISAKIFYDSNAFTVALEEAAGDMNNTRNCSPTDSGQRDTRSKVGDDSFSQRASSPCPNDINATQLSLKSTVQEEPRLEDPKPSDLFSVLPLEIDFGEVELSSSMHSSINITNSSDDEISFVILEQRSGRNSASTGGIGAVMPINVDGGRSSGPLDNSGVSFADLNGCVLPRSSAVVKFSVTPQRPGRQRHTFTVRNLRSSIAVPVEIVFDPRRPRYLNILELSTPSSQLDLGCCYIDTDAHPYATTKALTVESVWHEPLFLSASSNLAKQVLFFSDEALTVPMQQQLLPAMEKITVWFCLKPHVSEMSLIKGEGRKLIGGIKFHYYAVALSTDVSRLTPSLEPIRDLENIRVKIEETSIVTNSAVINNDIASEDVSSKLVPHALLGEYSVRFCAYVARSVMHISKTIFKLGSTRHIGEVRRGTFTIQNMCTELPLSFSLVPPDGIKLSMLSGELCGSNHDAKANSNTEINFGDERHVPLTSSSLCTVGFELCATSFGLYQKSIDIINHHNSSQRLSILMRFFVDENCLHSDLPLSIDDSYIRCLDFGDLYVTPIDSSVDPLARGTRKDDVSWLARSGVLNESEQSRRLRTFRIMNNLSKQIALRCRTDMNLSVQVSSDYRNVLDDSESCKSSSMAMVKIKSPNALLVCSEIFVMEPHESATVTVTVPPPLTLSEKKWSRLRLGRRIHYYGILCFERMRDEDSCNNMIVKLINLKCNYCLSVGKLVPYIPDERGDETTNLAVTESSKLIADSCALSPRDIASTCAPFSSNVIFRETTVQQPINLGIIGYSTMWVPAIFSFLVVNQSEVPLIYTFRNLPAGLHVRCRLRNYDSSGNTDCENPWVSWRDKADTSNRELIVDAESYVCFDAKLDITDIVAEHSGPCLLNIIVDNVYNPPAVMKLSVNFCLTLFELEFHRLTHGELVLPTLFHPAPPDSRPCGEWFVMENKGNDALVKTVVTVSLRPELVGLLDVEVLNRSSNEPLGSLSLAIGESLDCAVRVSVRSGVRLPTKLFKYSKAMASLVNESATGDINGNGLDGVDDPNVVTEEVEEAPLESSMVFGHLCFRSVLADVSAPLPIDKIVLRGAIIRGRIFTLSTRRITLYASREWDSEESDSCGGDGDGDYTDIEEDVNNATSTLENQLSISSNLTNDHHLRRRSQQRRRQRLMSSRSYDSANIADFDEETLIAGSWDVVTVNNLSSEVLHYSVVASLVHVEDDEFSESPNIVRMAGDTAEAAAALVHVNPVDGSISVGGSGDINVSLRSGAELDPFVAVLLVVRAIDEDYSQLSVLVRIVPGKKPFIGRRSDQSPLPQQEKKDDRRVSKRKLFISGDNEKDLSDSRHIGIMVDDSSGTCSSNEMSSGEVGIVSVCDARVNIDGPSDTLDVTTTSNSRDLISVAAAAAVEATMMMAASVNSLPVIALRGCPGSSPSDMAGPQGLSPTYEINLGQRDVGSGLVEWDLQLANLSRSKAVEYSVYPFRDDSDWLALSRTHGTLDPAHSSGSDTHALKLSLSATRQGLYMTYLLVENLMNPQDIKSIRVRLEVVIPKISPSVERGDVLFDVLVHGGSDDAATDSVNGFYGGGSNMERSVIDCGDVYYGQPCMGRSFIVRNRSNIPLEFKLSSNIPPKSLSELNFTVSQLSARLCRTVTVMPRSKVRIYLRYFAVDEESPGVASRVVPATRQAASAAAADLVVEVYISSRLVKDYQRVLFVRARCRHPQIDVPDTLKRFLFCGSASVSADSSQISLDVTATLPARIAARSVGSAPSSPNKSGINSLDLLSLKAPSSPCEALNTPYGGGPLSNAGNSGDVAVNAARAVVVTPESGTITFRNVMTDALDYVIKVNSRYFDVRAAGGLMGTVLGHGECNVTVTPKMETIRRYMNRLTHDKYVQEHLALYNRHQPTECYFISLRLSFGHLQRYYVAPESKTMYVLLHVESAVVNFIRTSRVMLVPYYNELIRSVSSNGSTLSLSRSSSPVNNIVWSTNLIAALASVETPSWERDLFLDYVYLVDQLVYFGLKSRSHQFVFHLVHLLFSVFFDQRLFHCVAPAHLVRLEDMKTVIPDVDSPKTAINNDDDDDDVMVNNWGDHHDQQRLSFDGNSTSYISSRPNWPPFLGKWVERLRHFLSFFPEAHENLDSLRNILRGLVVVRRHKRVDEDP